MGGLRHLDDVVDAGGVVAPGREDLDAGIEQAPAGLLAPGPELPGGLGGRRRRSGRAAARHPSRLRGVDTHVTFPAASDSLANPRRRTASRPVP